MRCYILLSLCTVAMGAPSSLLGDLEIRAKDRYSEIEVRSRLARNDLVDGDRMACPKSIFIWARGTLGLGNMGFLGPLLVDRLQEELDSDTLWVQGVGDRYYAAILDNLLHDGTSSAAIEEMTNLFHMASDKCPSSKITVGGYSSQGAALTAATIRDLDPAIRDKIVGVVLFGYIKNQQNDGMIVNYPSTRLRVYCHNNDLVCNGGLLTLPNHFDYGEEAEGPAPQFLANQIRALLTS